MHGGVLVDDGGGGAQAGDVQGSLDHLVDVVDVLEGEDELLEPEQDEAAGGDGDELDLWSNHPAHYVKNRKDSHEMPKYRASQKKRVNYRDTVNGQFLFI